MSQILAFAGSTRRGSLNKKLLEAAANRVRAAGATVNVVDLLDYPMPLYNGDLEEADGIPEPAVRLKRLMIEHDGLLLACPEYNSSITPLLKNTIDWVSRRQDGEPPLAAYRGKVAALLSASPGGFGGMRGLVTVRSILSSIGVLVLPTQASAGSASAAFDEEGDVTDEGLSKQLDALAEELVKWSPKP